MADYGNLHSWATAASFLCDKLLASVTSKTVWNDFI